MMQMSTTDTVYQCIEQGYRVPEIVKFLVESDIPEQDAITAVHKVAEEVHQTLTQDNPNILRVYANILILERIARNPEATFRVQSDSALAAAKLWLEANDAFNSVSLRLREANTRLTEAKADIAEAIAAATSARHRGTLVVVPDLTSMNAIINAEELPPPEQEQYAPIKPNTLHNKVNSISGVEMAKHPEHQVTGDIPMDPESYQFRLNGSYHYESRGTPEALLDNDDME